MLVLLVDDDRLQLDVASCVLLKFGYETLAAQTGAEALEIAACYPLDLIICDLKMPEMDGGEVARRLKADTRLCRIPIFVMTGCGVAEALKRNNLFDGYIMKPITVETFSVQVSTLFAQYQAISVSDCSMNKALETSFVEDVGSSVLSIRSG